MKDQTNVQEPVGHAEAWVRFEHQQKPPQQINKPTSIFSWVKAVVIAAIVLLIIGGSAIFMGRNKPKPADWVYVNAFNAKQKVNLPDGSKIVLRKGSSVTYSSDFGKTDRTVQLKGEAYFDVPGNPSIPFSVKSFNEITTEIGTSFFILSNDSVELVFVSSGRVKFRSNKNKDEYVFLSSGQKAELIGNKIFTSKAGNENFLAWQNEQLIFDRTTLQQVAQDIYNYYGVPIRFSSDINAKEILVTAQFANKTLSHIMEEIGSITGLLVKNEGEFVSMSKPAKAVPGKVDEKKQIKRPETQPVENPAKPSKKKKKKWWKFWEGRQPS